MRARILIGSLIVAACSFGIGRAAEQQRLADFRIVASFDAEQNTVALKCTTGCAWTDLTFSCRAGERCSSPVDEYGMTE
jgi:hypothetical protein